MKVWKKVTIGILVGALVLAAAAGAAYGGLTIAIHQKAKKMDVKPETFTAGANADRIHFMGTGSSDAILIESHGHFALVDAGEDSDYPAAKPDLNYAGYEDRVVAYLKKVAGDKNGKVTLDFVLGTHAHSDHIGGFDTIAKDPDITIKKAYLKEYHPENIKDYEKENWDNQEVYDQMVDALNARKVPIIQEIPDDPFRLGTFTIQFFNTKVDTEHEEIGENDNSVGTKITKGETSAFLAADMDNLTGDEDTYGPKIGKVDLLKAGHHGYIGSTGRGFVKALHPEIAVITNYSKKSTPDVKLNLAAVSKSVIFTTMENNGVIATFTDDGKITITKDACAGMPEETPPKKVSENA